jgi:hypothetical protein
MLLLAGALPYGAPGPLWRLLRQPFTPLAKVWLLAVPAAGLVALLLSASRGRGRHVTNFLSGASCLALPLLAPAIWRAFPEANPAALALGDLGSVGAVMCLALLALYAGSGMRVARPAQVPGQALGALGGLLLAVFAFLPAEGSEESLALVRVRALLELPARWRELLPFLLFGLAAVVGTLNLVRSRAEVVLAKGTRLLIVLGLAAWLGLPEAPLPRAWGALHLLAPLFLALDGAIAYVAVTITRSSE